MIYILESHEFLSLEDNLSALFFYLDNNLVLPPQQIVQIEECKKIFIDLRWNAELNKEVLK